MINSTLVESGIYRGPRPNREDYPALSMSFRSIISLEGEDEDKIEAAGLDTANCRLYPYPISPWQIYVAGISTAYLREILTEVVALPKPLLVHCQHGEDRTGMLIAAYRMTVDHWTLPAAMDEARRFGYHGILNQGLNRTLREYAATLHQ